MRQLGTELAQTLEFIFKKSVLIVIAVPLTPVALGTAYICDRKGFDPFRPYAVDKYPKMVKIVRGYSELLTRIREN